MQEPDAAGPTFARDVRAILAAHCAACHSRGGPAPMPLTTYEEVRPWAHAIVEQTLARRMPIWHAARGYGAFADDPSLTPFELDALVAWVDRGLPRGSTDSPSAKTKPRGSLTGARGPLRGSTLAGAITIPAGAAEEVVRVRRGWIAGWDFQPGDRLIGSATFTDADGATVGVWTAGDPPLRLPPHHAMRITPSIRVRIVRRAARQGEPVSVPRPSFLRFTRAGAPALRSRRAPMRRVQVARVPCGGAIATRGARILGIRPLLEPGASARITLERFGGAPPVLLGWFRNVDPAFARIYWLASPADGAAGARLTSDAPCQVDVIVSVGAAK